MWSDGSRSHHKVQIGWSDAKATIVCTVKRDGTEDWRVERSIQPCHPNPWAMSASVAMQLQGSVLISMAHITTREHGDIRSRGSYWGPCGRPGAVQSCLHPSLAVALWRVGFISLTVKGPCTSPREHHGVGAGSWGLGEVIPTPLATSSSWEN